MEGVKFCPKMKVKWNFGDFVNFSDDVVFSASVFNFVAEWSYIDHR